MSNVFCLRNLQESSIQPNYDNILVYNTIEESFSSETFRFLMEMNNAYREESKIFYRTVMESGNDFDVINEGVSEFLGKIKEIIAKFIKFLKSLLDRFSIMLHKMVGSDKYLAKNKDKLLAFDAIDNFDIDGYVFTITGNIPAVNALAAFNSDFLKINFDVKEGDTFKQAIQNQYDKFANELEDKYDKFRAEVIGEDGYITQSDFGQELFAVYRDGRTSTANIEINSAKITEALGRFNNFSELEKANKKIQHQLEKDYKEIEKKVARMARGVRDKDAPKTLTVNVDSDYASVEPFKVTNDEMNTLDMFIKAKANQILEMSNIHSMAFSYKLDAIKDCYNQDKKILYKALNQIAKNHKGGQSYDN